MATKKKTKRVQFELPRKSFNRLVELEDLTEATSYAEVVRKALMAYELVIRQQQAGNSVLVVNQDGTSQSIFDFVK